MLRYLTLLILYLPNHQATIVALKNDASNDLQHELTNYAESGKTNELNKIDNEAEDSNNNAKRVTANFKEVFNDQKQKVNDIFKPNKLEIGIEMRVNAGNQAYVIDQRNIKSLKLRKPIDIKQAQHFFVDYYEATLNQINDLRNTLDSNTDVEKVLNNAEASFKKQYKEYINNKRIPTRDMDMVLAVIDTIYFVKHFTDNLVEYLMANKALRINPKYQKSKALYGAFNRLLDYTNEHVCKEFGICRDFDTFREFFTNFVNIILNGSDDKIVEAYDSYMTVLGEEPQNKFLFKTEKTNLKEYFKKLSWISLRDRLVVPVRSQLSPIHNEKAEIKAGLDLIPASKENVAIWRFLTIGMREFMNSNDISAIPIFETLAKHLTTYKELIEAEKLFS